MAVERVFDTIELLEMILLQLPLKDILIAKAVTKRWKQVIDTSLSLRKATYTVANGDVIRSSLPDSKRESREFSLCRSMPMLDMKACEVMPLFSQRCREGVTFNLPWRYWINETPHNYKYNIHGFSMEIEVDGKSQMRMPEVCRSMFLTQPPVCAVLLSSSPPPGLPRATAYDKEGVTLGFIEQALQTGLKQIYAQRQGLVEAGWSLIVYASFLTEMQE